MHILFKFQYPVCRGNVFLILATSISEFLSFYRKPSKFTLVFVSLSVRLSVCPQCVGTHISTAMQLKLGIYIGQNGFRNKLHLSAIVFAFLRVFALIQLSTHHPKMSEISCNSAEFPPEGSTIYNLWICIRRSIYLCIA